MPENLPSSDAIDGPPGRKTQAYTLAPVTGVEDVPTICTILRESFEADPIIGLFMNNLSLQEHNEYYSARFSRWFEHMDLFGVKVYKVIDNATS